MTRLLAVAVGVVLAAALVGLAALPTGAPHAEAVVPPDSRVAGTAVVDGARVLLVSKAGRLRVVIAYRGDKGWFGARATAPPAHTAVAWTATRGAGPVPALSAVYGRVTGATVQVQWADGRASRAVTATDGTFVTARAGRVRARAVLVRGANGDVVERVAGP